MSEAELFQAYFNSVNLAYTAGQWWITVSTALVVATYFAAKHIPHWLFAVIIALYVLTAMSSVVEENTYMSMAGIYLSRLDRAWAASSVALPNEGGRLGGAALGFANVGVFVFGTISAVAYAFVTWRAARKA